jgi:nicotinamide mononucleotide adenylyltransferase
MELAMGAATDLVIAMLGRFQPVHNGHVDTFQKLLEGDPDVVFPESRPLLQSFEVRRLVIGVVEKPLSADNPLPVGLRRRLLRAAISDAGLMSDRVSIEWAPHGESPAAQAIQLRAALPLAPSSTVVLASGNPRVVEAYRAAGLEVLRIRNRPRGISATQVRKLLANDDPECAYGLLPRTVLRILQREGHVQKINEVGCGEYRPFEEMENRTVRLLDRKHR